MEVLGPPCESTDADNVRLMPRGDMGQCYAVPTMRTEESTYMTSHNDKSDITESQHEQSAELMRKRNNMKKRVAVAAQQLSESADIEIPNHPKKPDTLRMLERAVDGNLLFQNLSLPAKLAIFTSMSPLQVSRGALIIKQGDPEANSFYVLESGTCDVMQEDRSGRDRVVQTCAPGSAFGELALLYASPRAATVIASSDCRLWMMERKVYKAIRTNFDKRQLEEKWSLMDKVTALQSLDKEEKMRLVEALELKEYADGDIICYKGEPGDTFYLIKEGCVNIKMHGQEVASLKPGDYFGEKSLLSDEPRNADVVAEGYVVCHTLSRKVFQDLLGNRENLWQFECLRKVPVLCALTNEQIWQILEHMTQQNFERGNFVFKAGEPGETFYIVSNGNFRIFNDEKKLADIGVGSCFGELALLSNNVRAAHVMALESGCTVLKLSRSMFTRLLGSLEGMNSVWRYEALKTVPLFGPLSNIQVTQIAQSMEEKHYSAGADIITHGTMGDMFFVIQQGEVMVVSPTGKELTRKGPKDYFGELSLLKNEPRAATVRAVNDTTVLALNRKKFDDLMGPLKSALIQFAAKNYREGKIGSLSAPLSTSDIHPVCVLGQGAFGKVVLARYLGQQYALKVLNKSHVVKMGLQEHVKREAKILMECKNDFIVNLVATAQSEEKLYMMMEPVLGGELFTYLRKRGEALPENDARFYVACVVQALEYLQVHHIAYRDLKPENLLIAKDGYLKMADFGFAKRVRSGRTYTLCGTPDYLAPELVLQCGHNYAVDWWALGVLIFEMVNGYPPFYDDDKVVMYKNITDQRYYLPRRMSKECKDLVKKLLNRNPSTRLGMGKVGATAVKAHPWFQGFDWHRLATKTMTPPYVPKVQGNEDSSNFDPVPDDSHDTRKRYVSTGNFRDF
eukprot:jgi/Tetstr1/445886/TSEL_003524.t1